MAQFCLYDVDEDNNLSILEFFDKVGQVSTIYRLLSIGHICIRVSGMSKIFVGTSFPF
jgi:hypothetical protein